MAIHDTYKHVDLDHNINEHKMIVVLCMHSLDKHLNTVLTLVLKIYL